MPSLAEFNIGLSFVFDTSAANTAARGLGQTITELKTNVGSLIQQFPQLATSTQQTTTAMQGVQQQTQQTGQGMQQLEQTIDQSKTGFSGLGQSVTQVEAPMQQLTQQQAQLTTEVKNATTAQQQQIAILNGAGTATQKATDTTTQYTGALANVGNALPKLNQGLNETNTLNENLAGSSQTTFEKVQALGGAFGMAAGSMTGLIFSAHSLNRAHVLLERVETSLESAQNKLEDQTRKLGAATLKYGSDSEQVAAIQEDIKIQTDKISNIQERATLVQESYNMQLVTFATTTGPLVISTVSSMSQGITSMGEVLNISRSQVTGFIKEWGGIVGVGTLVVGFAADVVHALQEIQIANEDLARSIEAHDWVGALEAKLRALTTATTDPGLLAIRALQSLTGQFGNVSGLDIINLDKTEKETVSKLLGLKDKLRQAMQDPDWVQALSLPPQAISGIQGDLDRLESMLVGMAKNLALGVRLDPTYLKNFWADWDNLFAGVTDKIQKIQAEAQRVLLSGTPQERGAFLGLPTNEQWTTAMADYKGHLQNAIVLFQDYLRRKDQDATLSWDTYISTVGNATKEEIGLAKMMVDERTKAGDQIDQVYVMMAKSANDRAAAEKAANDKIIKAHQDEMNTLSPLIDKIVDETDTRTKAWEVTVNQAKAISGLNDLTTVNVETIKELAAMEQQRVDAGKKLNETLIQEGESLGINAFKLAQWNTVNDSSVATINMKNQKIRDLIITEGDYLHILGQSADAIDKRNQAMSDGVVAAADFLEKTVLTNIREQEQLATLQKMAQAFGIQVPAGIELTLTDYQNLIRAMVTTGNTAEELQAIHNKAFKSMHDDINKLVDAAVEGGKQWREAFKVLTDEKAIPKGLTGFVKSFFEDLADVKQVQKPLEDTISILHALSDAGVKLKDSQVDKFANKLTKELRDLKDELNDFMDKDLVGALVNPLIDLSKLDLSQTGLNLVAAQIDKVNKALKDGTAASQLGDFAQQASDLQLILAKPGELGSPEAGTGNDIDLAQKTAKDLGLVPGQGGGGGSALANSINQLKEATKGGATQIKTDTDTINVALQGSQTAFLNLATQGSNSMSILVANLKPHVETLNTYFGTTIVNAVGAAAKSLLAFKIIADAIMGGGSSKGNNNLTKIVFPGGGSSGIPGGNFLGDNANILPNLSGSNSTGSNGQGPGINPLGGTNFQQLRTSGGTGNGTQNNPLLNFFLLVQKAAAQTSKVVQTEFTAMYTALQGIFTAITVEWDKQMVAVATDAANAGKAGVIEFTKMEGNVAKQFDALDKAWQTVAGDIAQNAVDAGKAVVQEFTKMESKAESLFDKLDKAWQTAMGDVAQNARDAAKAVNNELAKIKDKTVTITCKQSGNCSCGKAEGGLLSFAEGGELPMSAADGLQFVTSGRQTYTIGDNNSAHESIWAIPNDRPQKTVREINEAYGFGGGSGGTTVVNLSANINVYTQDGQYVGMARVRKKFAFQNLEAH